MARSGRAAAGRSGGAQATARSTDGSSPLSAAVRAVPAVIERALPALVVLGVVAALFLLQEEAARRDPKLGLAPIGPEVELTFDEPTTFLGRVARPPGPRPPAAT